MIAKSLHQAGYEVDTCNDGEEALEMICAEMYDLIVLDLNLPGMDGMDILRVWILLGFNRISSTGLSPSMMRLSKRFDYLLSCHDAVRNPKVQVLWFGLFPFRSPLLRKSMFLSPPAGT